MPERNRDQSLDTMLRHVLSAESAPADVCVDAETVAAWTTGALQANTAADVERHLAHCSRCQALVAALVHSTPAPPAPEPVWRRWHLRWLVPLATAATAVAIWVAAPGQPPPARESASTQAARQPEAVAVAPAPAPSAPIELERSARPQPLPRERDTASREEKTVVQESRESALADLAAEAPASPPPPAAAEAEGLQKAEPSSAQLRTFATAIPTVFEITSPGETSRWRVINGQQVEWTPPAAAAGQPAAITTSAALTAGMSPSPSVCWLVGRRGTVFLTTNGSGFARLPFPEMVDLVSVTAVDGRAATVVAADGRRFTTQDRGVTWTIAR